MGIKGQAVQALRRASVYRPYRDAGAALVRHNSRWLLTFTRCTAMYPAQHREEFVPFLDLVRRRNPRRVLEIGASRGGTFFMLCQALDRDAQLATLDLQLPPVDVETYGHGRQLLTGITGDSTDPAVRERVGKLFPDGVDLLFIDGDHSYDGVKNDFDRFHDLLRPGGMVAFHDVVPDGEERTGTLKYAWSGGVPTYWREFKAANDGQWQIHEFVRSWDQDGFGIGVAIKT